MCFLALEIECDQTGSRAAPKWAKVSNYLRKTLVCATNTKKAQCFSLLFHHGLARAKPLLIVPKVRERPFEMCGGHLQSDLPTRAEMSRFERILVQMGAALSGVEH